MVNAHAEWWTMPDNEWTWSACIMGILVSLRMEKQFLLKRATHSWLTVPHRRHTHKESHSFQLFFICFQWIFLHYSLCFSICFCSLSYLFFFFFFVITDASRPLFLSYNVHNLWSFWKEMRDDKFSCERSCNYSFAFETARCDKHEWNVARIQLNNSKPYFVRVKQKCHLILWHFYAQSLCLKHSHI